MTTEFKVNDSPLSISTPKSPNKKIKQKLLSPVSFTGFNDFCNSRHVFF